MNLLEEINKIQGERQADVRIKNCLAEIYNRMSEAVNETEAKGCDCDCDELRAECTRLAEKLEESEEENDNLRAMCTELAEEGEPEDDDTTETEDTTESDS